MTPTITKEQAVQLARSLKFIEPQPYDYGAERDRFILTHGDLHTFAQAAYKLGRNAGLEEAKRAALDGIGLTTVSTVERIESLKGNT